MQRRLESAQWRADKHQQWPKESKWLYATIKRLCLLLNINTRATAVSRSSPRCLFGSQSDVTDVLTVSNSRVVKSQLFGSAHEPDAHFCPCACTYGMVNELTVSFVKKEKKWKAGKMTRWNGLCRPEGRGKTWSFHLRSHSHRQPKKLCLLYGLLWEQSAGWQGQTDSLSLFACQSSKGH